MGRTVPTGQLTRATRGASGRRWLAGLLTPLVLVAAGCTTGGSDPTPDPEPAPFAACAALTAPPTEAAPSAEAAPPATATGAEPTGRPGPDDPPRTPGQGPPPADVPQLPAIELPCFTGGEPVALTGIRGPAVINVWASWCTPCRKELPAFQRLADRSTGQLHVVGVDVRDRKPAAVSLAETYGLSFPNLFDPDEELLRGLARNFVPMTLFVDGTGTVRHLDVSGALDDAALTALVGEHLGVVVGP
ncbi:TlpA family protein disulfide reductase [Polymorphospora rubra]|uniref:TlpA family protein disulfide reductase n=1 Tax=Polymorphospora rubra TaxID=338584 RepID=UPI0033FC6E2C